MERQGGASDGSEGLRPGALSALLHEIASAPHEAQGGAWEAALRPGASIGKFELIREIGRGGFGVVWEARDKELGRTVAFKAVQAGGKAQLREERLLLEAEAAARLSHPNIVTLHDLGRSDHGPYLVLELLQGRTLEERLSQGRLSLREAVRIGSEVAKGLAHAHAKGVVHRDLKPANVFLCDDGQVKVLDFGLAQAFGQRRQDGGTPAYMAPEQWQGAPEDERTDVFALGVVLFRMLAGELPFPDDAGKIVQGPARAPALEVPELPGLAELVARMLEKGPVARPRDGREVSEALRVFQGELERVPAAASSPVTTRPRTGLPGLLSEVRRRRVIPAMVGYGTFALVALRGADWLAQTGRLPGWTLAAALALLGLGLPVSLFLAWTYDLTGQGIRRTGPAGESGSTSGSRRRTRLVALLAGIALLAAVPGGVYYVLFRDGAATSRPVAGADGRIVVAVADFANETRDPDLDGLAGLLVTSLEESRKLRVVTRSRMADVLRQMGKSAADRIEEPLAREVGRREEVRALLLATVRKLGETYAVDLRALDPMKDEYLFAIREQARDKGAFFDLVDRLSERTRRELQEPGAEVRAHEVRVAEAATSSIEAWRHYAEGLVQESAGRPDLATASWRKAVAIDPRFALAWFRIAYRGYYVAGDEVRIAMASALREVDRLSDKDRLLVEGWKARWDGRRDEAIAILSRAADAYPREKEFATSVGELLLGKGEPAAAVPWLERAQALDPGYEIGEPVVMGLVFALVATGRADEAIQRTRSRFERAPGRVSARALAAALQLAGRPAEAVEVMRGLAATDGSSAVKVLLASALCVADRPEEAERLLRPLATDPAEQQALVELVNALTEQGRRREALALTDRVTEPGLRLFIRHLILMGDRDPRPSLREGRKLFEAERMAAGGSRLFTGFFHLGDVSLAAQSAALLPPGHGPLRAEYEAVLLWSQGQKERSLEALRALSGEVQLWARRHWWRARVAYDLGEVVEGDAALLAFEREPTGMWRGWGRAQLLVWAAEAHARRGEREKALAELDRLERIWARADRDLPQVADARALRTRLARTTAPAKAAAPAATPSIAVLPFADMSPGKDQEYLAEGIAEEILGALARVDGLRVVGRTSSWFFKGKNSRLADIGRQLGVSAVVEGSVRRDGSRLRVAAKLLAVPDGRAIWSETFDRDLGDVFALEEEIAYAVAAALELKLLAGSVTPSPKTSTEAYLQSLLGWQHWGRSTAQDVRLAVEAFERALAFDPGYAPAWAGLAWSLDALADQASRPEDVLPMKRKALDAADRAVALGPAVGRAYLARGGLRGLGRHEWTEALADLERAAALQGDDGAVHRVRAWVLAALGRVPEAVAAARRATDLEPLAARGWAVLGIVLKGSGSLDEAGRAYRRALQIAPEHEWARRALAEIAVLEGRPADALAAVEGLRAGDVHRLIAAALAEHELGHRDAARRALDELVASHAHAWAFQIAEVHAWSGRLDEALAWLDRADAQRDVGLMMVKYSPLLRPLRADPRWNPLLRKLNLPVDEKGKP